MDISLHSIKNITRNKIHALNFGGDPTYCRTIRIEFGKDEVLEISLFSNAVEKLLIKNENE